MPSATLRTSLGALTGLLSLVAMVRLIAGAFTDGIWILAWAAILLAMVPWIGYAAWRARHGRFGRGSALAILLLNVVGTICVWLFTLGPVLALACSLAAFVVIWVNDWPTRPERTAARFVRIEEFTRDDSD